MYQIIANWAFDENFLNNRMSFISGPRQIGKTTVGKLFLSKKNQIENYHNWDSFTVKKRFVENQLFFIENLPPLNILTQKQWILFDEIHKFKQWKNILKGYYDEFKDFLNFIVCGSARLDIFRKTGESLLGRYFLFRMFPLGPNDIVYGESFKIENVWNPEKNFKVHETSVEFREAVKQLFEISGFPEPFLKGEKDFYNRWHKAHISLITTEEIRDLTKIYDINRVQMLSMLLPARIGSPVTIKNLSDTLEVAHQTVKVWLNALENVYLIFQIPPYSERVQRSIKKEKKIYFWDWGIIEDKGKKFENFIAVELYRTITAWNEWGWGDFELFYLRTKDGRETDFLVTNNKNPFLLIESKLKDTNIDKNLLYFHKKLNPKYSFQIVFKDNYYKQLASDIFILDIAKFLKILV